jgi:hypothetical protein
MTDGDPFGRRSGRKPEDRGHSQSSWDDEGIVDDPYDYPPVRDPRRSAEQRQPAADPYAPQGQYPPYRQDPNAYPPAQQPADWDAQQGAAWPERPYAAPQQRRSSRRQPDPYQQRPDYEYGDQEAQDDLAGWEEQRPGGRRAVRAPRAARPSLPRPSVPPALTAAIAGQDSRLLLVIAGAALSLAAMAAMTATRVDALPGWFPLHIDASGETTRWGSESALWRLPFGLAMLTLMNVAAAFLLGLRDHRVAWLFIGSLPLIHILGWIALILIAW